MRALFSLGSILIAGVLWARAAPPILPSEIGHQKAPWFTGPLLAPAGVNIANGHYNVEPYVFATHQSCSYDSDWKKVNNAISSWDINTLMLIQFGLTDWLDFTFVPAWFFKSTDHSTSFNLGDLNIYFGFQLYKERRESWFPSIRLVLKESFPIGRFERLDPEQEGTDIAGSGAYTTTAVLALSKLVHLWGNHWTNMRFSTAYSLPAKVRVHGVSHYGGSFDTDGWVYPPQTWQFIFSFELNLSQRWVMSFDSMASFSEKTRFKGRSGVVEATGKNADLTLGSSAQYSIAPGLEYNWSPTLGVISGVWFTVAGRNAQAFTSWVTALNYYY